MGQSKQVAQRVFGKPGDQEENERYVEAFMGNKKIELVDIMFFDDLLNKLQAKHARNAECQNGAGSEANRREDNAGYIAE